MAKTSWEQEVRKGNRGLKKIRKGVSFEEMSRDELLYFCRWITEAIKETGQSRAN